mmetsp:Transcript_16788/g.22643  ORF Transcript_16788/g.22643 Transcript_16788/m.22643 type:complete len:213 (+) Transcript_16788:263-901(+)
MIELVVRLFIEVRHGSVVDLDPVSVVRVTKHLATLLRRGLDDNARINQVVIIRNDMVECYIDLLPFGRDELGHSPQVDYGTSLELKHLLLKDRVCTRRQLEFVLVNHWVPSSISEDFLDLARRTLVNNDDDADVDSPAEDPDDGAFVVGHRHGRRRGRRRVSWVYGVGMNDIDKGMGRNDGDLDRSGHWLGCRNDRHDDGAWSWVNRARVYW